MKYAPSNYLDMIVCQNKNSVEAARKWEQCAKAAQLPVESISVCKDGQEGMDLLKASFKHSREKGVNGTCSPKTPGASLENDNERIFLAGKPYTIKRSENALLKDICNAYTATRPEACWNTTPSELVRVTILSDKRCAKCQPVHLTNLLQQRLKNSTIKSLEYTTLEGKAFYESLGDPNAPLPLVLFDSSLDADGEAAQFYGKSLHPVGSYRSLDVSGSWNPACADEGGCNLDQCKETLACRKAVSKKLEVFLKSVYPYAIGTLNAMEAVQRNFGKEVDFSVHYIGSGTVASGFNAEFGGQEVDEDIRELCARRHYRNYKWMDYFLCRNKDRDASNWQRCAVNTGIDPGVIDKCVTDEGKRLLEEDFEVVSALGIQAHPTWVVNGNKKFIGLDAETIKKNFCDANKGLKGCE